MKIEMKNWEIERVVEKISEILNFWSYDSIEVSDENGHKMSMSKDNFLEQLRRELNKD